MIAIEWLKRTSGVMEWANKKECDQSEHQSCTDLTTLRSLPLLDWHSCNSQAKSIIGMRQARVALEYVKMALFFRIIALSVIAYLDQLILFWLVLTESKSLFFTILFKHSFRVFKLFFKRHAWKLHLVFNASLRAFAINLFSWINRCKSLLYIFWSNNLSAFKKICVRASRFVRFIIIHQG